jgi:hypothetical protein
MKPNAKFECPDLKQTGQPNNTKMGEIFKTQTRFMLCAIFWEFGHLNLFWILSHHPPELGDDRWHPQRSD